MHDIALDLLILLGGIWLVAITLRPLGLPTVMGELIVGVLSAYDDSRLIPASFYKSGSNLYNDDE